VTPLTCTVRVPPICRAASTAARRARAKSRILAAVSCASRRRPATSARRSWRAVVPAMRIAWRAARCMGSILATTARRARAASRARATVAAASGREARRRIAWACSRSRRAHWIAAPAAPSSRRRVVRRAVSARRSSDERGGGAAARTAAAALSATCARTAARCPSRTRPEMVCAAQHANRETRWARALHACE
jgi:hypothetical protein